MRESTQELKFDRPEPAEDDVDTAGVGATRHADLFRKSRKCLERIEHELSDLERTDRTPSNDETDDDALRRIQRLHREKKATLEAVEMLESRDLPPVETPEAEPCFESLNDSRVVESSPESGSSHPDILKNRSPFEETAQEVLDPSSGVSGGSPNPRMN